MKISTGFNATPVIRTIFDAYRAEADAAGIAAGPDCLALRRRISVAATTDEARAHAAAASERFKSFVAQDSRLKQNVPDAPPPAGGFTISDDEYISGTPTEVAEQIIEQCRAVGAGHFLAVLHWGAPIGEVAAAHELFGGKTIPILRKA